MGLWREWKTTYLNRGAENRAGGLLASPQAAFFSGILASPLAAFLSSGSGLRFEVKSYALRMGIGCEWGASVGLNGVGSQSTKAHRSSAPYPKNDVQQFQSAQGERAGSEPENPRALA